MRRVLLPRPSMPWRGVRLDREGNCLISSLWLSVIVVVAAAALAAAATTTTTTTSGGGGGDDDDDDAYCLLMWP